MSTFSSFFSSSPLQLPGILFCWIGGVEIFYFFFLNPKKLTIVSLLKLLVKIDWILRYSKWRAKKIRQSQSVLWKSFKSTWQSSVMYFRSRKVTKPTKSERKTRHKNLLDKKKKQQLVYFFASAVWSCFNCNVVSCEKLFCWLEFDSKFLCFVF